METNRATLFIDTVKILKEFDTDPMAQECLTLFRKLPEDEKPVLLQMMDAFLRGYNAKSKVKNAYK